MWGEKETAVKAGEIDDHVGSNAEAYEDQHVNMDLGLKKGKGFWSFVQL